MFISDKIDDILSKNPIYGYLSLILAIACIVVEFLLPTNYNNSLTNMILLVPAVIFPFTIKYRFGLYILITTAIIQFTYMLATGYSIKFVAIELLPIWIIVMAVYVLINKEHHYRSNMQQELLLRKDVEKEAVMESIMLQEKNTLLEKEIKERIKYQKELDNATNYYFNLIENADIAMGISDLNGIISYVNENFTAIYKRPKEKIIGQAFVNMLPPLEQSKLLNIFNEKVSGVQTPGNLRTHILDANGKLIHVHIISDLVYENDEVVGVRAYIWDISDQVDAENAVRESEEKFRSIFEYSPMGIYRSCPAGSIVLANPALLNMLKFPDLATFQELNLNKVHPAIYNRKEFIEELQEKGKIIGKISEWERYDGAILYIKETSWTIKNDKDEIIYYDGIIDDVTEQVQAEQEKERLIEQLLSAKSEIQRLSGMLPICSHCKKIRDDTGYWHQIEVFIDDHSDAQFSHGICPDCAHKIYPDYSDDE